MDSFSLEKTLLALLDAPSDEGLASGRLGSKLTTNNLGLSNLVIEPAKLEISEELRLPSELKLALSDSKTHFQKLTSEASSLLQGPGSKVLESFLASPSALNEQSAKQIEEIIRVILSSRLNTLYQSIEGAASFLKDGVENYRSLGVDELLKKLEIKTDSGGSEELLDDLEISQNQTPRREISLAKNVVNEEFVRAQVRQVAKISDELVKVVNELIKSTGLETLDIAVARALESLPEAKSSEELGAKMLLEKISSSVASSKEGKSTENVEKELRKSLVELADVLTPKEELGKSKVDSSTLKSVERIQRAISQAFEKRDQLVHSEREVAIKAIKVELNRQSVQLVELLRVSDSSGKSSDIDAQRTLKAATLRTAAVVKQGDFLEVEVKSVESKDATFGKLFATTKEAQRETQQTIRLQRKALELLELMNDSQVNKPKPLQNVKILEAREAFLRELGRTVDKPLKQISERELANYFPKDAVKAVLEIVENKSGERALLRESLERAVSSLKKAELPKVEGAATLLRQLSAELVQVVAEDLPPEQIESTLKDALINLRRIVPTTEKPSSGDVSKSYERAVKNVERQLEIVVNNRQAFFGTTENLELRSGHLQPLPQQVERVELERVESEEPRREKEPQKIERPIVELRKQVGKLEIMSRVLQEQLPVEASKLNVELSALNQQLNAKKVDGDVYDKLAQGAKRLEQALAELIEVVNVKQEDLKAGAGNHSLREFLTQLRSTMESLQAIKGSLEEKLKFAKRTEFEITPQAQMFEALLDLTEKVSQARESRSDVFFAMIEGIREDLLNVKERSSVGNSRGVDQSRIVELFEAKIHENFQRGASFEAMKEALNSPMSRQFFNQMDALFAGQLRQQYEARSALSPSIDSLREVLTRAGMDILEPNIQRSLESISSGEDLLLELSRTLTASETKIAPFSLEHEQRLVDVAKELLSKEGLAQEIEVDSGTRELIKQLVSALESSQSLDSSGKSPKNIEQDLQLLTKLEGMLKGQEFLNQLNPVMQSLGEPAFILFPLLMNGFFSRIEMLFYPTMESKGREKNERTGKEGKSGERKVPEVGAKEEKERGNKRQRPRPEHFVFSVELPSVGKIEVSFKEELGRLLLTFKLEEEEAVGFFQEKISGLEPLLEELGFRNLHMAVEYASLGSLKPNWVTALEDNSLCVV